jgi:hypothetical protein
LYINTDRKFQPKSFSLYGRVEGGSQFDMLQSAQNEALFTNNNTGYDTTSKVGYREYYINSAHAQTKYSTFVFILTEVHLDNVPCIAGLQFIEFPPLLPPP